ncbi:AAA family ATPase [Sinorhizobium meliloti]|uniref:AAA family ATPase n=1 Tax=Rhizobium meliloti TaxID=382 RepID=UPI003D64AE13
MKADVDPESRIAFSQLAILPGEKLPRRKWIMPGFLLRGHVTELVASSGAGKSSLALAIACHLAAGRNFGRFRIDQRYRVAIATLEEDDDELNRRLSAIAMKYGLDIDDYVLRKHLMTVKCRTSEGLCLARADRKGVVNRTSDMKELERRLFNERIDVLSLDPLAELWQGNENDNSQVGAVLRVIRSMARCNEMAVLLNHHTGKGTVEPGNIDAARGASSGAAAVRFLYTLTKASKDDATALGLNEEEAKHLMRLDLAKGQYRASAHDNEADFFRFHSIDLGNGNECENADHVGVLFPEVRRVGGDIGRGDKAERVFMNLMELYSKRRAPLSVAESSRDYAPRKFFSNENREGLTQPELTRAMFALIDKGVIVVRQIGTGTRTKSVLEIA